MLYNIYSKVIRLFFMASIICLTTFSVMAKDATNVANDSSKSETFSKIIDEKLKFDAKHARQNEDDKTQTQNKSYNQSEARQYGISYGMGEINSSIASKIAQSIKNSKAKLGFYLDSDNNLSGEGDVLIPLHDGQDSVAFLQTGARTMENDRWIVNLGLGERYILSEDWLIGYNGFLDQDITRNHTRVGAGIEAWHKYLHISSNYYAPVSKWRKSKDLDDYQERAARGWDIRAKGYLPFYEKIAVTGGFSKWYGDGVAIFNKDTLEKNPKIWSYGLEYTPIPLVTTSVNQRQSEKGQSDTEFGMFLTYDFAKSWEEMTSLDMPNRTKSIRESRFDFVDRENKIILNYRKIPKIEFAFLYITVDENLINNSESDNLTLHLTGLSNLSGQPVTWEIVSGGSLATLTNIHPTTNASGESFTTLVAAATGHGDVVIKASLGGMSVYTTITVGTPPPTIELAAQPQSVSVDEDSIITLSLSNTNTSIAHSVVWDIISGTADKITEETVTSTPEGLAQLKIKAKAIGTIRVKATVDGQYTESIDIEVAGVKSASLESNLDTIGIGESLNLTFTLSGITPIAGNSVVWSTDTSSTGTGVFSNKTEITGNDGKATAEFTGSTEGNIKFVVTSEGIATTYNIQVINRAIANLVANPTSIDVSEQSTLIFTYGGVTDVAGKTVTWSVVSGDAGAGNLSNNAEALTTNSSGQATNYLNGLRTGSITIQAECEGKLATATIEVGRNTRTTLSVDRNTLNFGESNVIATLQVSGITPLDNRTVNWTISPNASFAPDGNPNLTNSSGIATKEIVPTDGGIITITAEVDGITKQQTINVTRTPLLELSTLSTSVDLYSELDVNLLLSNISTPDNKHINWEIISGTDVANFVSGGTTANSQTASGGTGDIRIRTLKNGSFVLKASIDGISGLEQYITIGVLNNATATLSANPSTVLINRPSNLSFNISGLGNNSGIALTWIVVNDTQNSCTLNADNISNISGNAFGTIKCSKPNVYEIKVSGEGKSISTFVNVIEQMAVSISAPQSSINIGDNLDINALIFGLVDPTTKTVNWSINDTNIATLNGSNTTSVNPNGNSTIGITANNPGDVTITANVDGIIVSIVINVKENPTATLTSNKSTMIVRDTANLNFNLSGLINLNGTVNWSIISGVGTLGSGVSTVLTNGVATNTVTSATTGPLTIRASSGGASADFTIDVRELPLVTLTANPIYVLENVDTNLIATLSGVSNLSAQTITWQNITAYGVLDTTGGTSTDSNGLGNAKFRSDTAGAYKIQATINGFSDFVTIEVISQPKFVALVATPITPYVGDNVNMLLTVTSDGGGSVVNKSVTWSIIGGDGEANILSSTSTTTDSAGNSTLNLKATKSGDVRVRADVDGVGVAEYTITILDRMFVTLSADKDNLKIDDEVLFTLNLTGTGVVGDKDVTWVSSNASLTTTLSSDIVTNGGGVAQLKLKAVNAGQLTITATVDGISSSYTVNIIEKPVATLTADNTTILAGNSTSLNLLLSGAAMLNGDNVSWQIVSGGGFANLSGQETSTHDGGKATALLNATAPGTVVVKTTTTAGLYTVENYITITILQDYWVTLNSSKTTIKLGENLQFNLNLFGGLGGADLNGKAVTWTTSNADIVNFVGGSSSTTAGGGLSTKNVLASTDPTKTGTVTIIATVAGKSASLNITVVDTLHANLTASSVSIDYGNTSTLTLTLTDTNVLAGRNVTWEMVSGSSFGTLTPIDNTTLAGGTAKATIKGTGVGTIRVKTTVGGVENFIDIVINNSVITSLTASNYTVVTGNTTNLTFSLSNFNGMPIDNLDVLWEVVNESGGGIGTGTLSSQVVKTDSTGKATATFNGVLTGSVKVRATLTAFGKSSGVTINVINNPVINITAPKSTIYVGEILPLTVNIISGVDNMVQNVTWNLESAPINASISPTSGQTGANGKAITNLQSTSIGTISISATILGVKTYYTVNVVAQPVVTLTAPKYSIIKNENLVVTLNLSGVADVVNKNVTWSIVSGAGTITPINVTTLGNGTAQATVSSNTLGSFTVQAVVGSGINITKTVVIDVIEIPIVTLTSNKSSIYTDSNFATLTANLSGVSVISGQSVTWEIVSGTNLAHFSNGQSVTSSTGNATIRLYGDLPGTVRVKVTIKGVSAYVNVEVKSSAKVTLSSDCYYLAYNEKATITANLTNISPLAGQEIEWEVISGGDYININGKDNVTDQYGRGNFIIHNKVKSDQQVTIKVTIAGVSSIITINLVWSSLA